MRSVFICQIIDYYNFISYKNPVKNDSYPFFSARKKTKTVN